MYGVLLIWVNAEKATKKRQLLPLPSLTPDLIKILPEKYQPISLACQGKCRKVNVEISRADRFGEMRPP
jgi:hypothetical protein